MSKKEEEREYELIEYSRNMFWHEPEKQDLIKRLLKRIYALEDIVEKFNVSQNKSTFRVHDGTGRYDPSGNEIN